MFKKLAGWILISLLLAVVQDITSTIEFGVNLEACTNETKAVSEITLVHCTNFREFPLCVGSQFQCNFVPDCPIDTTVTNITASDETSCAEPVCNFENNSTCGWKFGNAMNGVTPRWSWKLSSALQGNSVRLPVQDHTFQKDGNGHYVLADLRTARSGENAVLETPLIGSTDENCTLEYYYYIVSGTHGKLQIVMKANNSDSANISFVNQTQGLFTKVLETALINETDKWMKHSISWSRNSFYSISFLLVPSTTALQGVVAIDDVSFKNCTQIVGNSSSRRDPFGLGCPEGMFNCLVDTDELNCIIQFAVCNTVKDCPNGFDERFCSCDDYPTYFCPTGECSMDDKTLKPTCKPEHESALQTNFTIATVTGGAVLVLLSITFIMYKLISRRRFTTRSGLVDYAVYDVTFALDATQLEIPPRPSTSSASTFRMASNISNSNLLELDKDWGLME